MSKGKMVFAICLAAFLSVFVFSQAIYAAGLHVNLERKSGPESLGSNTSVVSTVLDESKKLASGQTLTFGPELIDELTRNAAQGITVTLNGTNVADIADVTNPVGYMIGYASTGLAGSGVGKEDNTYSFTESTLTPHPFTQQYATEQVSEFAKKVEALLSDEIAVIIATTMTAEQIMKIIGDTVDLGKVVIVQAVTIESQEAFAALFQKYGEGFNLRNVPKENSKNVVRAFQGAV